MPDRRRDREHVPKGHHSERDGFAFPKTVVAGEGWNTMKTECLKERSAPDVSSSASATACRSFGAMLTAFRYASMVALSAAIVVLLPPAPDRLQELGRDRKPVW